MKAVSARQRSKYDELVYGRAGVQKWLARNFAELNTLKRNSAFMAEFVAAVNSRLTAAKTPQRRDYYAELLEEMTDALCKLNTDLNHAHVRHDRAHKKAAWYTAKIPRGWRYRSHWSEVLQKPWRPCPICERRYAPCGTCRQQRCVCM